MTYSKEILIGSNIYCKYVQKRQHYEFYTYCTNCGEKILAKSVKIVQYIDKPNEYETNLELHQCDTDKYWNFR